MIGLLAEEEFAILETNTSGAQPMPIRVLNIMHPNRSKSPWNDKD